MKSNIRLVSTNDMSNDQWLAYRMNGIGASEVGTIMGLNPYKASIQLFYEKIGEIPPYSVENLAMFLGKENEDLIGKMWEYWDPSIDDLEDAQAAMIQNYRAGKKIRRYKHINAYAHNEKYPWLFVSLDGEINKYDSRGNGALEKKMISGYEADKWTAGIPPGYVIQNSTQLVVCEYLFGEIAILKDNRSFWVLPFERNKVIEDEIIERTHEFWKKVETGRILVTQKFEAQRNYNLRLVEQIDAELAGLEPEPDGSEAFSQYLKEKYKIALPGERAGNAIQLKHAQDHKAIKEQLKKLEEAAKSHENALKNDLGHEKADRFDFGPNGYIQWKADSNGVRRFINKIK